MLRLAAAQLRSGSVFGLLSTFRSLRASLPAKARVLVAGVVALSLLGLERASAQEGRAGTGMGPSADLAEVFADVPGYYELREPRIEVLPHGDDADRGASRPPAPGAGAPPKRPSPNAPGGSKVDLDELIRIGQKIYEIIRAGKPVVATKGFRASVVPKGLEDWRALAGWKAPRGATYSVVYENLLGMEVVRYSFDVLFSFGGSVGGKGAYLANVTVKLRDIGVAWGFSFDSRVEVGEPLNVGSASHPIAGLQLDVHWTVSTLLKTVQASQTVFVQGDGELVEPLP